MDPRLTGGDGELKVKVITKAKEGEREREPGCCLACAAVVGNESQGKLLATH